MANARTIPQIDSVYVYNERRAIKFSHREQPEEGYRYKNRHALLQSKENEIHLYHQTIEIGGVLKGITIVTMDADKKRVHAFLKTVAKEVKSDPNKLAIFNSASIPVQLDIFHIY